MISFTVPKPLDYAKNYNCSQLNSHLKFWISPGHYLFYRILYFCLSRYTYPGSYLDSDLLTGKCARKQTKRRCYSVKRAKSEHESVGIWTKLQFFKSIALPSAKHDIWPYIKATRYILADFLTHSENSKYWSCKGWRFPLLRAYGVSTRDKQ